MGAHTDGATMDRLSNADLANTHIHMIGVGGAGMSGAAGLLLKLGARVSGSDLVGFDGMGALVSAGARLSVGHEASQLDPWVSLVVASAAIPESNPELVAARRRNLPVLKYAELVGLLMARFAQGVAVAGTHGKSSTSAMAAYLFRECGLSPSFLIGANSKQLGGNSGLGEGIAFIAECCEFDRSFLHVKPTLAVILNIEPDHLDCYRDLDDIVDAFSQFGRRVASDGWLIVNGDCPFARNASRGASAAVETFGFSTDADWRGIITKVTRGCHHFEVHYEGQPILLTSLSIAGRHNMANALAAIALSVHAGADPDDISRALPCFEGVERRMMWRGEGRGVTIVDDYAHHPTEIRVSLEAIRVRYQPKRMVVIFQPHQAERTKHFITEFAAVLAGVDETIIPDTYGARENDEGASAEGSAELAKRICGAGGRGTYLPSLKDAADHVLNNISRGDLVVTMGAGDVWKIADELVERICGPGRT